MSIEQNLWPGWETVRLIGQGSFGAVYEIRRDVLGEPEAAALKVITIPKNDSDIEELYAEGYDKGSVTTTFRNHLKSIVSEYTLMRKMTGSANIVNCDDVRYVQHDDGIGWDIFIKMELLTPLNKALPSAVPEQTVIHIAKDLCQALVLCKKHDIIHRDIKPQNIFLSPNGDYKLGDFGIAKTVEKTTGGTKIGTYKYMAPEVYNNQPYGSAADIYSLGLVLYWLLNERRLPFLPLPPQPLMAGADEEARVRRLSGDPVPPPVHGSDALKAIVLKACVFDPRYRYQSAAEMLEALNRLDAPAAATSVPTPEPEHTVQEEAPSVATATSTGTGTSKTATPPPLTPLLRALPANIPEAAAIALGRDICSQLVQGSAPGIIRQDIEPQNIFLSSRGQYLLGDATAKNIVRKGNGTVRIGNCQCMAPEVYHNQPYGTAAEVYSVGLVLYWMLNGCRMPFQTLQPGSVQTARQRRLAGVPLPPPPQGSAALQAIVLKACVYKPQYRYASPAEMLKALNALVTPPAAQAADIPRKPDATPADIPDDLTCGLWSKSVSNRDDSDLTENIYSSPEK